MNRLLLLINRVKRAVRLLHLILAEPCNTATQPGLDVFPKRIFELDTGAGTVPDGRSPAYATLARELRMQSWSRDGGASPLIEQWFRRVHAEVLRAHELELRLLAHLESKP